MSTPLSQLLENILQDSASQPSVRSNKKSFFSWLSYNEKPKLSQHTRALHQALSSSQYGGYHADKAIQLISPVLNHLPSLYRQTIENDPQYFYSRAITSGVSKYAWPFYVETLKNDEWLSGEKHHVFRLFPFICGFLGEARDIDLKKLYNNLSEKQQQETFLLCLLGNLKKTNSYDPLIFTLRSVLFHLPIPKEEISWVFRFVEEEGQVKFNGQLANVMNVLLPLAEELESAKSNMERNEFYQLNLKDLKTFKAFESLDNRQLQVLGRIVPIIMGLNNNILSNESSKLSEITTLIEDKLADSEMYIMNQLHLAMNHSGFNRRTESVINYLKKVKKGQQVSQVLYEGVWDYHFRFPHWSANMEKFLRQQTSLRLEASGLPITWEALLWSGFKQVPIPMHHSPYHGLHPDQVRPFFQLLREVANVDIIKIYQVEKRYHVRFLFNGEMFDLPTGDGFGTGCMNDLNTLLFENGIPYQLVVLEATLFTPTKLSHPPKTITLINEATYQQFKPKIVSQNLAGFAKSDQPAPIFLKNIADLGKYNDRTDLDQIDLGNDPKFSAIRDQLNKLHPLETWTKLLHHCLKFPLNSKPGKTWQSEAKELIDSMELDQFRAGLVLVVDSVMVGEEWFSDDEKICGLRGLTWLCRLHPNPNLLYLSQKIANKAYKKVKGGALNAKLGNIALEGLVKIGTLEAYGALGNLKAKAKYPVYLRSISSAMKKFTGLLKQYPAAELEDRVIPHHEMQLGKKSIPIGSYQALLELEGMKVKLKWQNDKGKITASAPAEIRSNMAAELKGIKAEAKSIEETLAAQAARLEKSWLEQRSWPVSFWKEFYQSHALMGVLVEKLIWMAEADGKTISFMSENGQHLNYNKQAVTLSDDAIIQLWHPALSSSVQEVEAWRNLLFDKRIVQPFKQAFREVYLLTPAEEATFDHSLRFAGHYLRGNTLYSLGKNRGWTMTYDQAPLLKIPAANLYAELAITGGVLYSECTTQGLHFKSLQGPNGIYNHTKLPLSEIPPVILSEVMRDVDLFVAVGNIGIDPYFDQNNSGELLGYWKDVAFGAKSKTSIAEVRKDLLGRLLPMTKIGKQCKLEGNFLEVQGKLRSYKINLNSGNILMLPNDQYLCIVQKPNAQLEKKIWLPFEGGDQTLMVILSKAFLLADDDKIQDASITWQIKNRI